MEGSISIWVLLVKTSSHIDVEEPRHLLFREVQRWLVLCDAGIGNHAVQAPTLGHNLF